MRWRLALVLALALPPGGCGRRAAPHVLPPSSALPKPKVRKDAHYPRVDLKALPPPDGYAPEAGSKLPDAEVEAALFPAPPVPPTPEPRAGQADAFIAFEQFAMVAAAGSPGAGALRRSALLDQGSVATIPRRSRCREQKPAVLLDLDPGKQPFDLGDAPAPAPGLASALALLRVSGIRVLWLASLPQSAEPQLRTVLRATELDPDGSDPVLLLRAGIERKQAARQAAARNWCIVAIAGDRRADFDEIFDYMRDPDGPIAQALEANIGDGWFLTPLPIG